MIKLSIPKVPFINKKWLLIVVCAAIVAGLLVYGIVRDVQATRVEDARAASLAQERRDHETETAKRITTLTNELTAETAKSAAVCDYIRSLAAKNPRVLTVPPLCKV